MLEHNSDTYFLLQSLVTTFSTMTLGNRKLVVLGIPWDVDTEGLRRYMCQFGDLEDVIVMKDRVSRQSRGFGYVTFSSYEGAQKAMAGQHVLQGRTLEVKIATPKDEMRPTSRKITRIFVARISPTVTDEMFRSYFEKYGSILDAYMPKDQTTKQHRGIGFVTYENAESVDKVMSESHELAGSTIAVDRATPKEETGKVWETTFPGASGVFNSYVNTAQYGTFDMSAFRGYDFPGSVAIGNTYEGNYGRTNLWPAGPPASQIRGPSPGLSVIDSSAMKYGSTDSNFAPSRVGRKIFVGRIPVEATAEDLQLYFEQFGQVLDVYLPKDAKKISHRGFGFVTFAEESIAEHVSQRRHEILGHLIAVDHASPLDETPGLGVCAPYGLGKKIFIGRIPLEATTEDLRLYFSQYGHILDVYIPKDAKKISHRGFGFVTFAEESTAEHVAQKTHEILGHRIAVDRAAPLDEARSGLKPSNALFGGAGGPLRGSSSSISQSAYENMPANLAFNSGWTPYFGVGHVAASGGGTSGHQTSRMETRQKMSQRSLWAQLQAVADMKFTYVVSCQRYAMQKRLGEKRAADILNLMKTYPSLRVAYIDEVEERKKDKPHKVYYSILVKAVDGFDQIVYRIKLPGNPTLGEGKPENQNHAIIFTRGEALQTIDMNQDNYLEEAFKMRNLLEEFVKKHGVRRPTILGLREHIFTGSVSSLAWFMSNQETSFVTIVQRLLANPLKVRFHYGHPDVFDRLFHITRGGISKASKGINLSEDVFGGFNSTLRYGTVTYHEYMQVGKGRDVGLNQISQFEAKVATGNGEQTLSRDIYRLGHRFDFFRMLSCYFTTVGFYFSSLMTVLTVYIFLYGRMYLVLSGLECAMLHEASVQHNTAVEAALASQSFVQLGFLLALPMVMEIGLERGFLNAFSDFVMMQLQMAAVFFTFSLGTKTHYYGRTLLHGGAKYRATGRGFVVFHAKFADNYRFYSRSHFVKGLELMLLLIVDTVYSQSHRKTVLYILITYSMWFMVGAWLFAPFLFNPSGFEWQKIVDDWTDWNKWINNYGGSGLPHEKSWESWWDAEQDHLKHAGLSARIFEILLSFRFLLYPHGLVYHQNVASVLIYALFWAVIAIVLLVLKTVFSGRRGLSGGSLPMIRLLGWFSFLGVLLCFIIGIVVLGLPISGFFASYLSDMLTGWAFLQIALACRPLLQRAGFWNCVRELARFYDHIMGLLLFTPVAILAWFPFVSEFQTRILFNQAFSRGFANFTYSCW